MNAIIKYIDEQIEFYTANQSMCSECIIHALEEVKHQCETNISEYVVHQFPPPRDNVYLVKRRDNDQLSLREAILCDLLPKLEGKVVEKDATYTNARMNCVQVTITYGEQEEDMPVWML